MSRPASTPSLSPATPAGPSEITRGEHWVAAAFFTLGLVLRLYYIWHYRIDSDETQHMHVVWGWTHGLLPYRDVVDNHAPLFQALFAPLFHVLGVRADILLPMRAGELPIYALTVFCVWKIVSRLWAPRPALWTAVLTAFLPPLGLYGDGWFLSSIEFRPDQLWALVWVLVLLVLGTARLTLTPCFSGRAAARAGFLCVDEDHPLSPGFGPSGSCRLRPAALCQRR